MYAIRSYYDFGVSKLLDAEASSAGTRSAPWLTPAYASPEQVRGAAVSTLSDVYALGVILYELLSGTRPYRLEGCSPAEIERSVITSYSIHYTKLYDPAPWKQWYRHRRGTFC